MSTSHPMAIMAIAIAASIGTHVVLKKVDPPKASTIVSSTTRGATTPAKARAAVMQWGEMEQAEVDRLTILLKAIVDTKEAVTIFCGDSSACGDLALDLENAFESAKWDVRIERPMFDDGSGLTSNSLTLAAALDTATNGRINPKSVQRRDRLGCAGSQPVIGLDCTKPKEGVYISLGRKPK